MERLFRGFLKLKKEKQPPQLPVLVMSRSQDGGWFVAEWGSELGKFLADTASELVIFNTESLLRPQVFISGALTGADNALPIFYEGIGEICKKYNLPPYIPHLSGTSPQTNPDLTPTPVVRINRKAVKESGLMITVLQPSLGVGRELETACREGIPVILVERQGVKVSRAGRGDLFVVGEAEVVSYNEEALPAVENTLVQWLKKREEYTKLFRDQGYKV